MDKREQNVKIFEHTEKMCKTNNSLKEAVKNSLSKQELVLAEEDIQINISEEKSARVIVSNKRTLEATEKYVKEGKRVCVLNFASATNPGGGVTRGSSAQEEAICRCSTLFSCLNIKALWDKFYVPHRKARNLLYNNDCIYTPEVVVIKRDSAFPELLPEEAWWKVDVISCAAPNLRNNPNNKAVNISNKELRELLRGRVGRIFELAIKNGVDVLILGAFGCGAFSNPPSVVAEIFSEFTEKYRKGFDVIEYAVYHTEREKANYDAFRGRMMRFTK